MFKLRKNKKGFTLIELIVVIAILAILAAVAVPVILGVVGDAEANVNTANARTIVTAFSLYNALHPDGMLSSDSHTTAQMQAALEADGTWPAGMSSDDATAAWALITVTGTIAEVTGPAAEST